MKWARCSNVSIDYSSCQQLFLIVLIIFLGYAFPMRRDNLNCYFQYLRREILTFEAYVCPKCSGNAWTIGSPRVNGYWLLCHKCGRKKHISILTYSKLSYQRINNATQ